MYPWITKKKSGIEYYYHPFLETHSFYSPDRKSIPFTNEHPSKHSTLTSPLEEYCDFCLGRVSFSTPHKSILIKKNHSVEHISYPSFKEVQRSNTFLRRQGNLFEIIPYSFWQEKYNIKTSQEDKERIINAFNDNQHRESLEFLLALKYNKIDANILHKKTQKQKLIDCEPFFSGFHELLTSGSHYQYNDENSPLFHSGQISWEEHRLIFEMIHKIMRSMLDRNSYIQYIAIFQNWLSKAGASFDHWHKQILAIDFWGEPLLKESILYQQNSNIYRDFILEIATNEELFIAENKHAIAYIETGTKSGQIIICSKSVAVNPLDHSKEEWQSMSDLLHAIYTILPPMTPYNEEWIYTPFHQDNFRTPWRIAINIRTNINAGFENITQHLITSMSIKEYALLIREQLQYKKHLFAPDINICRSLPKKNIFNYI